MGRLIDVGGGWKDPGILKFVPTCFVDKRLRIQNPVGGGTMRNSAFRVGGAADAERPVLPPRRSLRP